MLRSTMRKLARCLTTTSGSPARAAARRPALTVEGLEDRLVLSTASLVGSVLTVTADPGSNFGVAPSFAGSGSTVNAPRPITFQAVRGNPLELDVFDSGALLGQFKIASIKTINVSVAGRDAIDFDDSNDLPFAAGTNIFLNGSGSNSLSLTGSHTVDNGEAYYAGSGPRLGELFVGGATFNFGEAIGSVTDTVKTTGPLVVTAYGPSSTTLSGQNGVTQQLTGLANFGGGGDTLTFSNKSLVNLELSSTGSSVALNATAAAAGERSFVVDLFGKDEPLYINATPSAVDTSVVAAGQNNVVELSANSGRVFIDGNSSTLAFLGTAWPAPTTAGIKQDVFVSGVGALDVIDTGNVTKEEHVTVTESTVSGAGLFGNDAAVLHYSATSLAIATGQLANTYTVVGSHPGARFASGPIVIDDGSALAGLSVQVGVDAGSDLDLRLYNDGGAVNGDLYIQTLLGGVNPESPTFGTGTETVTFEGGYTSTVSYVGFSSVVTTVL